MVQLPPVANQWIYNNVVKPVGNAALEAVGAKDTPTEALQKKARAVAAQYGIDPTLFLAIISHESSWDPMAYNSDGGAGGLGGFLPSTAAAMGTTVAELQKNPDMALDYAAQLIKKKAAVVGNDPQKIAAAYFVGEGTVLDAMKLNPTDWVAGADQIAQSKGWGSVTDYLGAVGVGPASTRNQSGSSASSSAAISPTHPTGQTSHRPSPNDDEFWAQDEHGAWQFNNQAYQQADQIYLQNQQLERDNALGPYSAYLDAITKEMEQEIAAGNMSVSKADSLIKTRAQLFQTSMDVLSSDAFKRGAPAGAAYVPSEGPDSFRVKTLGLSPVAASGQTVDPLAEAVSQYKSAESMMNAIPTPTVPDTAGMLKSALQKNGYLGADGLPVANGGVSPPPGPPPPPPSPSNSAVLPTSPAGSPPGGGQSSYIMPTSNGLSDEELLAVAANLARNRG